MAMAKKSLRGLSLRMIMKYALEGVSSGGCAKKITISLLIHNLLLENLLSSCKVLIINTPRKRKVPKETNWKQKFQKPQNENICLTYLNTEKNGNFLSFGDAR